MTDRAVRLAEALQPGRIWRPRPDRRPRTRALKARMIRRLVWSWSGWQQEKWIIVYGSTCGPDGIWNEREDGGYALDYFLERFEPDD